MLAADFVDETAAWRAKVAAEVAARYGVAVAPDAVTRVAQGASGLPQIVWDGKALVYDAPADAWRKAGQRAFKSRAQAIRMGIGPGAEVQARRDEVARLHALGLYDPDIAEQVGIALATVRCIRYELGLESNGHNAHQAMLAARTARVMDMLVRGHAPALIAAQEGLKAGTVKSIGRDRLGMSFARLAAPKVIAAPKAPKVCPPAKLKAAPKARKVHRPRAECEAARGVRRQSVAALAAEGFSQRDIAKKLGVSARTVSKDLADVGCASSFRQGHYYPRTKLIETMKARRASVLCHLRQGMNCRDIARLIGCSLTSVREDRDALRASGVFDPATAPPPPHRQRQAQVLVMLQQGLRRAVIAKALGVTISTIRDDRQALIAGGADIPSSGRGRQIAPERAVSDA